MTTHDNWGGGGGGGGRVERGPLSSTEVISQIQVFLDSILHYLS